MAYLTVGQDFGDLPKDSGPRPLLALICKAREKAWGHPGNLTFCSAMETQYRRHGENMPLDEQKLNGLKAIAAGISNPNHVDKITRPGSRYWGKAKSERDIDALLAQAPAPEVVTAPLPDRHCNTCDSLLVQREGERHDRFMQRATCGLNCGRIYGGRKGSRGPREFGEVEVACVVSATRPVVWETSTFISPPGRAKLMAGR